MSKHLDIITSADLSFEDTSDNTWDLLADGHTLLRYEVDDDGKLGVVYIYGGGGTPIAGPIEINFKELAKRISER
jgi:hypothetical protein